MSPYFRLTLPSYGRRRFRSHKIGEKTARTLINTGVPPLSRPTVFCTDEVSGPHSSRTQWPPRCALVPAIHKALGPSRKSCGTFSRIQFGTNHCQSHLMWQLTACERSVGAPLRWVCIFANGLQKWRLCLRSCTITSICWAAIPSMLDIVARGGRRPLRHPDDASA